MDRTIKISVMVNGSDSITYFLKLEFDYDSSITENKSDEKFDRDQFFSATKHPIEYQGS